MAERRVVKEESDGKDTYIYYSNGDVVVFDEKNKSYSEKSTDANGVTTWTYFDAAGNVEKTTEIDPNGTTTETKSDGTVTRTEPNGNVYTSNRDGTWKSYDKASDILTEGNAGGG
jgi:RHS Repeat